MGMRLRTFLIRRAIHTVITLVIVLVLLFVIFRLMPGDPSRFFIQPGQTPESREDILVEFGFLKRVPAPGAGYRASFVTSVAGTYEIRINVTDSRDRAEAFYFNYTRESIVSRAPRIEVQPSVSGRLPSEVVPGDNVNIDLIRRNIPAGEVLNSTVTLLKQGSSVGEWYINNDTSLDWPAGAVGAYTIRVRSTGSLSGNLTAFAGVSVNPLDPTPFQLVGEKLDVRGYQAASARVTINVTASGALIAQVAASVRTPDGSPQTVTLSRVMITVENNILEEFWAYMTNMLVFDFGTSPYTRQPVWTEINNRIGPSLLLFGAATIISYLLGIIMGAVLAWRRGSKMELSSIVVSLFFYSMPVFWFGLILLWAFAFKWELFPLGGYADLSAYQEGGFSLAANILWHMTLPLLNLVILSLAGTILLMRNSMLEVMGEDYITTAKAKGLSERRVMYHHAARNAMLPVVTAFALSISGVISGGVLTETIFSWPGMGAFLVTATIQQDFASVQGAFYLLALLTILANLIADVLYAWLDPRVRL